MKKFVIDFLNFEDIPRFEMTEEYQKIKDAEISPLMLQVIQATMISKPNKRYTLVTLDVDKVDKSWTKDSNYVDRDFDKLCDQGKVKLLRSKKNLINLEVTEPPIVDITTDGEIYFRNGRHRFANMRNFGVKTLIFMVEKYHNIDRFK